MATENVWRAKGHEGPDYYSKINYMEPTVDIHVFILFLGHVSVVSVDRGPAAYVGQSPGPCCLCASERLFHPSELTRHMRLHFNCSISNGGRK